jgi:predicted TIM-barrel fold metal-dependent hydrolase
LAVLDSAVKRSVDVIDVHTHHMTAAEWGPEWEENWAPVYHAPWPERSQEEFDAAMSGVDVAIVFGIRASRLGVRADNTGVARFCDQTKAKTIGFMALDPSDIDVLDQLDEGRRLGLRGIKLYPVLAGFYPADPALAPFYRAVEAYGLPLMWHVGTTPSRLGTLRDSTPLAIDEVAQEFPRIPQVMAHMGHPWQRETIAVLRKNPRVFADVSGQWSRPMEGYLALVRAQEWTVIDRLLFGSYYPLWTPNEGMDGLWALTKLGGDSLPRIEPSTIDTIISADALGLLGLR